jgi:hypothetical protein
MEDVCVLLYMATYLRECELLMLALSCRYYYSVFKPLLISPPNYIAVNIGSHSPSGPTLCFVLGLGLLCISTSAIAAVTLFCVVTR